MPASGDFRLSISRAMTDQLHDALHELDPAPLGCHELELLEPRQGVYQLYLGEDLVYVGSAAQSLPARLSQHFWKLAGRQNIAVDEVRFTCLYVDEDLTVLAPEDRLIKLFQDEGSCAWNGMGFGLHDPGRNRDTTELRDDHFDRRYPVRLDWSCEGIKSGSYTVTKLARALKGELPYLFRYANTSADRAVYGSTTVNVPEDAMAADDLLAVLAAALPTYQVTALSGYVIMYREQRAYPQGRVILP